MADQILLITGPSASAFCYGLMDTGRFIRVYPETRRTQPSGLFGGDDSGRFQLFSRDKADKSSTTSTKKPNDVPQNVRNPQQNTNKNRDKPDDWRNTTPSQKFNAPVDEKSYDFAVRGDRDDVSAVMEIIRAHSREFETWESADNIIRVNCVGSPERTKTALNEIRQRL